MVSSTYALSSRPCGRSETRCRGWWPWGPARSGSSAGASSRNSRSTRRRGSLFPRRVPLGWFLFSSSCRGPYNRTPIPTRCRRRRMDRIASAPSVNFRRERSSGSHRLRGRAPRAPLRSPSPGDAFAAARVQMRGGRRVVAPGINAPVGAPGRKLPFRFRRQTLVLGLAKRHGHVPGDAVDRVIGRLGSPAVQSGA